MRKKKLDIIFAGVGGQGSVLVSHLLADAAIHSGYKVKLTETFGAAMRGGSVYSAVRLGDVWSPLPCKGKADVVVGLEPLEALRVALEYISPESWVLLNQAPLYPVDVSVGRATYPPLKEIHGAMNQITTNVLTFNATSIAESLGDTRMMNIVMLGALMALGLLDISKEKLFEEMGKRWNRKIVDANMRAYKKGLKIGQEQIRAVKG